MREYTKEGFYFLIRFDYDKDIVDDIRSLSTSNKKYFHSIKTWMIRSDINSKYEIISFLKKYNFLYKEFKLMDELVSFYDNRTCESNINILDKYENFSIEELFLRNLKLTPRKYQIESLKALINEKKLICGDDIGVGKTAQMILLSEYLNLFPTLVVCPSSVKEGWKRQWLQWSPNRSMEIINSGEKPSFKCDVTIINYDLLSDRKTKKIKYPKLKSLNWKNIVFDESHYLKNKDSIRSKISKRIAKKRERVYMLTGSMISNRPYELINQLEILESFDILFENRDSYLFTFCDAYYDDRGYLVTSGASNTDKLYDILKSTIYYRRDKRDVLNDLPELQSQIIEVDISNSKEYREASQDLIQFIEENYSIEKAENAMRSEVLVKMTTLRMLSQKGKIKEVIEFLENFFEQRDRFVLFGIYKDGLSQVKNHFKDRCVLASDYKIKQDAVDEFNNNPSKQLFIANIQSMGTGVDGLQQNCSDCGYLDLPLVPIEIDQATGRVYRSGQKNAINEYFFLSSKTIDSDIYYDLLFPKKEITDKINKGVDFKSPILTILKKMKDA